MQNKTCLNKVFKFIKTILLLALAVLILFLSISFAMYKLAPIDDKNKNWASDHKKESYAKCIRNICTIYNFRDSDFNILNSNKVVYTNKTFNLNNIDSVWLAISPFNQAHAAHTFISFLFKDGESLTISYEARREEKEEYSIFLGMLNKFENILIIGSEKDILALRTNQRGEPVYIYKIKMSKNAAKNMLVSFLNHANKLHTKPEWYHTLFNNCSNNLIHAFKAAGIKMPLVHPYYIFNESFPKILEKKNLLFEKIDITDKAKSCLNDNFSLCIRK